jgi:sec-independent protein translocase protein TatC
MKEQEPEQETPGASGTIISHLVELRGRLLKSIAAIGLMLLPILPFSKDLFTFLAEPLLRFLPSGTTMIATQVASPFLTPFKLALVAALFLAMPSCSIRSGRSWRRVCTGGSAASRCPPDLEHLAVLRRRRVRLLRRIPGHVQVLHVRRTAGRHRHDRHQLLPRLHPGAVLRIRRGIRGAGRHGAARVDRLHDAAKLAAHRGYVLIGAFVVGAVLTPPDVFSQTLLAVPMYLLYEAGIVMARIIAPSAGDVEAQEET